MGEKANVNNPAIKFIGDSLYVLAGPDDTSVKLYKLGGSGLQEVSRIVPIEGTISNPSLFELNGHVAVACGDFPIKFGAGRSCVFELVEGVWQERSMVSGGASGINSIASDRGNTYVLQYVNKVPKLLTFAADGTRIDAVDLNLPSTNILDASLVASDEKLYLTLVDADKSVAQAFTADYSNLTTWNKFAGDVYKPASWLSSVALHDKLVVMTVSSSGQIAARSHGLPSPVNPPTTTHTATFKADGKVVATVEFTEGDASLVEPPVPAKAGHSGSWQKYILGKENIVIEAVYTANTYTATFKNWDEKVLSSLSVTYNSPVKAPSASRPNSNGWEYVFDGWSPDFFGTYDQTKDMVYTARFKRVAIEHTVTFVADGKTIARRVFNEVDKKLVGGIPGVPAKAGYTGVWSSYTLGTKDITVTARYVIRPDAVTLSTDAHVQGIGWIGYKGNGAVVGTTGSSLRMESIKVRLAGPFADPDSISVQAHVQGIGWMPGLGNNKIAGTTGRSLRIEAMKIKLSANLSSIGYHIYYRVHAQGVGWMGWAHDGASAGTAGNSLRLEAIQILLVAPGQTMPSNTYGGISSNESHPYIDSSNLGASLSTALRYDGMVHVQSIGNVFMATDGARTLGTTGRSLRLEGIKLVCAVPQVDLTYRTHVQGIGWQSWVGEGNLAGTQGRALRLEALQIKLTGAGASRYDVYYRTHVQGIGWTGWARNGQQCGSAGYSYRMEAVQVMIIPKGGAAPGLVGGAFYQR